MLAACCAQIENEFGFIGPDETYMRHITKTAKNALRDDVILFTTDPPDKAPKGTLKGGELFTCAPFHLFHIYSHVILWSLVNI